MEWARPGIDPGPAQPLHCEQALDLLLYGGFSRSLPTDARLRRGIELEIGKNSAFVLVIEDDPDLRDVVTTILALDLKVSTATAEDGEQGLALAQELRPDAVLLDINLPKLSGFEVARRLKADPLTRAIPILAVTSESRSKTLAAGCDDHVGKPFDLFELVRKLRACLQVGLEPGIVAPNLVAV